MDIGDFERKKDAKFLLFCESKHGGTIIDYTCKNLTKILINLKVFKNYDCWNDLVCMANEFRIAYSTPE